MSKGEEEATKLLKNILALRNRWFVDYRMQQVSSRRECISRRFPPLSLSLWRFATTYYSRGWIQKTNLAVWWNLVIRTRRSLVADDRSSWRGEKERGTGEGGRGRLGHPISVTTLTNYQLTPCVCLGCSGSLLLVCPRLSFAGQVQSMESSWTFSYPFQSHSGWNL